MPWKQNFLANCSHSVCLVLMELFWGTFVEAMWIHQCYSDIICCFGVALMTASTGSWILLCFRLPVILDCVKVHYKVASSFSNLVCSCLVSRRNRFQIGQICYRLVVFCSFVQFSVYCMRPHRHFINVEKMVALCNESKIFSKTALYGHIHSQNCYNAPSLLFWCVFFENRIYIFIILTILKYCIGRQSHRQQLFPRK